MLTTEEFQTEMRALYSRAGRNTYPLNCLRVYIYQETIREIKTFAVENNILGPNNKPNFPHSLTKYLEHLKNNQVKK